MTKIELPCPRIQGFVYQIENDKYSIYELLYKLIVYTLRSIWYYPFFQNDIHISVNIRNSQNPQFQNFCIELPIELPIGPTCDNSSLLASCGQQACVSSFTFCAWLPMLPISFRISSWKAPSIVRNSRSNNHIALHYKVIATHSNTIGSSIGNSIGNSMQYNGFTNLDFPGFLLLFWIN